MGIGYTANSQTAVSTAGGTDSCMLCRPCQSEWQQLCCAASGQKHTATCQSSSAVHACKAAKRQNNSQTLLTLHSKP